MNSVSPYIAYSHKSNITTNARLMLSMMLIAAACLFVDIVVGTRGIDVGTDTYVYAGIFREFRGGGPVETRFEPGFLLMSRLLAMTGASVELYQCTLFGLLLIFAMLAARRFFDYLGSTRGYLTFLIASLAFLLISPMFVNASINAVRQGLSSLPVFIALLAFHQRQWRSFFIWAVIATCFHYSALLYLAFAPLLLFNPKFLRLAALVGFVAYCTGITMIVVRAAVPALYNAVMDYSLSAKYKSGVRIDFAVFSIFWYLLPYLFAGIVRKPFSTRLKDGTAVYLVMVLPFFVVGWGNFSNRYLLSSYLAISLMVAAILFHSRLSILRNPILLRMGLVISCAVFYYYVVNQVIV
ncbi:EpsG family protein [Dyella choica]|uniref:EpsG family protein n=1 Tax=Dyella choica TaxID=1927959 RepID=A0A432M2L3_9GAMM|nr:EpsG family protein [Dyella choica]RUL72702.1 EpsG family protein [Dyella choica]